MQIRGTFRGWLSVFLTVSFCLPLLAAEAPGEQTQTPVERLASATPVPVAGASAIAKPDYAKRPAFAPAFLVGCASPAATGCVPVAFVIAPSQRAASRALRTRRGRAPPLPIS